MEFVGLFVCCPNAVGFVVMDYTETGEGLLVCFENALIPIRVPLNTLRY
jgi:hypothetical protein